MTEQKWTTCADPRAMLKWLTVGNRGPKGTLVSERKLRLFCCAVARQVWHLLDDDRSRVSVEVAERLADGKATVPEWDKANEEARAVWTTHDNPAGVAARCTDPYSDHAAKEVARKGLVNVPSCQVRAGILRDIIGNPFRPWMREDAFVAGEPIPGPKLNIVWSAWLTPQVVQLAEQAYQDNGGRACGECGGEGQFVRNNGEPFDCPFRDNTGKVGVGQLDPVTLMAVADSLEEAGCIGTCPFCKGKGCHYLPETVHIPRPALEGNWNGCTHGRVPHPVAAHLRTPGPHYRGMWSLDLILGKE